MKKLIRIMRRLNELGEKEQTEKEYQEQVDFDKYVKRALIYKKSIEETRKRHENNLFTKKA